MTEPGVAADALAALLATRRSIRGFAATPLPREELEALFGAAQAAPSWCNVQPWRVAIASAAVSRAISADLVAAATTELPAPELPFPPEYPEPYNAHRRRCAADLYGAMAIARGDQEGRRAAWLRNYQIFDAPHLAVVSCDGRLGDYALVDVGVWLGYLLAVAAARGLATCPAASVASYPKVLRKHLPIGDEQVILFGIAIGHEDPAVAANRCRTSRDPVAANVAFVGWSP